MITENNKLAKVELYEEISQVKDKLDYFLNAHTTLLGNMDDEGTPTDGQIFGFYLVSHEILDQLENIKERVNCE